MFSSSSSREAIHGAFQVLFCIALFVTAVRTSDDWISVKKVTPDPVFVTVGQTLKLRLDIENLQVEKWNTTAFWVRASDYDTFHSNEQELQLIRRIDSSSEEYCTYNKTRVSRERQIDLVLSGVTLADSGIYRCKFRRDGGWTVWIHYNVIVEEKSANFQDDVPQIVYVAKGDTLKLKPNLHDFMVSSYGETYEKFWDYSSSLASKQEEEVRIIGLTETSLENVDTRATLRENGTTLVLRNTTLNDSGVYHLRMTKQSLLRTAIHRDFNVVVEDKPVASLSCPRVVHLSEGEDFFCLCEDASSTEVPGQATWLQNGEMIEHTRLFHEEELFLKNVTVDEAGFYTCRVSSYTTKVDLSLQVFVFPVEQPMKGGKSSTESPHWYYLAGALATGLLLGIVLMLLIKSFRRRCRNTEEHYEDVRSVHVELDVTPQYQDMERNRPEYQEARSSVPQYEVPDISNGFYEVMNRVQSPPSNQETNRGGFPRQHEVAMTPGYTDLDLRVRVDSHPYQGLNPDTYPGHIV